MGKDKEERRVSADIEHDDFWRREVKFTINVSNEELINAQPFLEAMIEAEEEGKRIANNINALLGSGLDDFLEENGLLEEVTLLAKEKLKKEKLT